MQYTKIIFLLVIKLNFDNGTVHSIIPITYDPVINFTSLQN